MNARKSKALRHALGFHPAAEREYTHGRTEYRRNAITGQMMPVRIGTTTSTGARRQYQGAKRAGMSGYILGAN